MSGIDLDKLAGGGASDGDVPVWGTDAGLPLGGEWVPGAVPPAANGLPTGGADGQVLTKLSATDYDAAWETPGAGSSAQPLPRHRAGRWYGTLHGATTFTSITPIAGRLFLTPFYVPTSTTYDRIAAEVTTLAASSSLRFGIYDDADALVVELGTIAATTTGAKEVTISQTLAAGLYWLAMAVQGGVPLVRGIPSEVGAIAGWNTSTDTGANVRKGMDGVTGALPTTFVADGHSATAPRILLRAA